MTNILIQHNVQPLSQHNHVLRRNKPRKVIKSDNRSPTCLTVKLRDSSFQSYLKLCPKPCGVMFILELNFKANSELWTLGLNCHQWCLILPYNTDWKYCNSTQRTNAHNSSCVIHFLSQYFWNNSNWATSWENLFMPYAKNKDADQPAHPRNLISAFVVLCLDSIILLLASAEISRP